MKIPDGWVLVPREPNIQMLRHVAGGDEDRCDEFRAAYVALLAVAPPPPQDPTVAAGLDAPGVAGATFRMLDRFDWRDVTGWARGEMMRGTPPHVLFEVAAGCVASVALQVAGLMGRTQVREAARAVMTKAALVLEDDIKAVVHAKKEQTVLHNQIRLVPPG